MEPWEGLEGQVETLQHTLRLLVGLILSCLLFLFLLGCALLLGWRPTFRRAPWRGFRQASPASPQLFQVVPGNMAGHTGNGATMKQSLRPPRGASASGWSACPLPPSCCSGRGTLTHSSREQAPRAHFCSSVPPRSQAGHGLVQGPASSSSSLQKHPVLVPPNSPVTTSRTGGAPDGAFTSSCFTSTQEKPRSESALASATRPHLVPFEFGSSIKHDGARAQPNSANFTATQGPGLDTDFGASAGVSLRILSSDSEGSPDMPPLPSGRFEWDYYDPSFERKPPPRISSKQYWL